MASDLVASHSRGLDLGLAALWTDEPPAAARHLSLEAGFARTGEESHTEFGSEQRGQSYELALE